MATTINIPSDNSQAYSNSRRTPTNESFTFGNFFDAQKNKPLFFEKQQPVYHSANAGQLKEKAAYEAARNGGNGVPDAGLSAWNKVPAWIPIATWISLSSAVIIMNKWILADLGFNFPIFLTTVHLLFQTIASRILHRSTNLVDGAKELEASGRMNRDSFIKNIVPIGVLFSLSLVLSNWVYLRLSVSFIQMIKAITPVSVLLISFGFGLKHPSSRLFGVVSIISLGVGIASWGEVEFDMLGFLIQLLAIAIESTRLVLIQILLQGWNMSPLVSLYYYAPVCLCINSMMLLPLEGFQPFYQIMEVGPGILSLNAAMTFGLNLASVWLIGKASGLVLTLSGVLKDILLIAGSFVLLGSTITGTQIFGYVIAIGGLIAFKRIQQ